MNEHQISRPDPLITEANEINILSPELGITGIRPYQERRGKGLSLSQFS